MNKKLFLGSATAFLLIVFVTACVKDIGKKPAVAPPPPANICDSATYTFKIKNIIDTKCTTCHSPAGGPSGGVNLTNYGEVSSKADRIKLRAITNGDMPQAGSPQLTSDEKSLIQCWLDKGAPQ